MKVAVKGRLRFEILRRDNHTCRYCGASAPDVKLTVDHVVPESLGGSDDPTNLVTACTSCNSGKASIAPDSALVGDVAADATRYADALRRAMAERAERFYELTEAVEEFDDAWSLWGRGQGEKRVPVPRSNDWRNTLERWLIGGVNVDELIAKIPSAMADRIKRDGEWTYFCGIGWNMLTEIQERARELADLGGNDAGEESSRPRCEFHADSRQCPGCAYDGGYMSGWSLGREQGFRAATETEFDPEVLLESVYLGGV